jgi:ADP-ribose pyrophosphatase YjhB (NUDIX family)/phosphoglycolate phosphatase-like HAD superfamily hydrolase
VDDLPAVWEATNYVLKNAGIEGLSIEEFRSEFCLPFTKFYNRYTPHIPMEKLEEWFHKKFEEVQHLVCGIKYAEEFLRFCKENKLKTIVLSSVRADHYYNQARKTGFIDYIDSSHLGVRDKRQKIKQILGEEKLEPLQTIYIGDMEHDIDTARYAGVYSCAVLTGYNEPQKLRLCEPDLIVENLAELKEILEQCKFDISKRVVKSHSNRSRPVVTVGALIFNKEGKALFVQTYKWSNLWGIPGGKIKYGESAETALKREIKEETGLDIHSIQFAMIQDCIHSEEFYRDEHFVLINYVCICENAEYVKLNEEAHNFKWLTLDEALKLPLNKPTRNLVNYILNRRQNSNNH